MDISKHIDDIREEFPLLKYVTYFNCGGQGPALARVKTKVMDWWEFYTYQIQGSIKAPDSKGEAAKMMGVKKDDITWVNRVSQACNIVSSMMKLERGDNIVITDLGYPTGSYPFLPWREKGVEIRSVKNREGIITTKDFEEAIDDNTKVVSLSHIEWTSGILHDVKAVSEIAHNHGALVLDDGYQAQGNIEVNPEKDGVDFYTFGSQKWMCCPLQTGVLYVKNGVADQFEPVYRNYNKVEEAFRGGAPWVKPDHDNITSWDYPLAKGAEKFNMGCVHDEILWGFYACLNYFNSLGTKEIEKRNRDLSTHLIESLKESNVKINTPEDPRKRGGLVTYTTGKHELNQKVFNELNKEGIKVALRYAAGIGGIRVSTHFYNTEEEIDKLLKVQEKALK
jgi:cysteine desulfurase/selenocysteine lyase